jgi:hypothetical protein
MQTNPVGTLDPRFRGDDSRLRAGHFGAMRIAPSSLIASPFSISFSTMCLTSAA